MDPFSVACRARASRLASHLMSSPAAIPSFDQCAHADVKADGTAPRVLVKLRVDQVDLQKRQRVRDLLGRVTHHAHAPSQTVQRGSRGAMLGP